MKTLKELSSAREMILLEALQKIADPELGESIVDLGLILGVEIGNQSIVVIMTMTSPACPMGEMLIDEIRAELSDAFPNTEIDIELIWEPAWNPDMMSAHARKNLGWNET